MAFIHVFLLLCAGCEVRTSDEFGAATATITAGPAAAKQSGTGVLLVSHGSHSPAWRKMLLEFHDSVSPRLQQIAGVSSVKSAFMEYTEPSIATQLKAFDAEGCQRVIVIPLLLTVSTHSFDDIPTIVGARPDANTQLRLEAEKIECYTPRATVSIAPLFDFSELLEENLPRRVRQLLRNAHDEGVVLIAYGDETFNSEWEAFFDRLDKSVQQATDVSEVVHCWCGHIVQYSKDPTQKAINDILSRNERAIVIPVLVARDEMFQDKIIGGAIDELALGDRVAYAADAILPEPKLDDWVVSIATKMIASDVTMSHLPEESSR